MGYSGNCNRLISLSQGEYIAIFHADDIYEPRIIEEEIEALEENMDLVAIFTFANTINEFDEITGENKNKKYYNKNKKVTKINLKEYLFEVLETGNFLICPTAMIRRNVYKKIKYSSTIKLVAKHISSINF